MKIPAEIVVVHGRALTAAKFSGIGDRLAETGRDWGLPFDLWPRPAAGFSRSYSRERRAKNVNLRSRPGCRSRLNELANKERTTRTTPCSRIRDTPGGVPGNVFIEGGVPRWGSEGPSLAAHLMMRDDTTRGRFPRARPHTCR